MDLINILLLQRMDSPTETAFIQQNGETFNPIEQQESLNDHDDQENLTTSKMNFMERWQSALASKRGPHDSMTSWLTSYVKRRPLASLLAGAVLISSWLPLLLFVVFAACIFTIAFFSFIVFESCLIGAGLVLLLLYIAIPLCFSFAVLLSLFLVYWAFTVLRDHVEELVEYFRAIVIFYGTLYAPNTIRRMVRL